MPVWPRSRFSGIPRAHAPKISWGPVHRCGKYGDRLLSLCTVWGGVNGRVEGTITDATGAIIQGALVTALNTATGFTQSVRSGNDGSYTFPVRSVGGYEIRVDVPGFQRYQRSGITIDANTVLVVNASLHSGSSHESVTVSDSSVHVDTASTQMGDVISGRQMTAVPLNGRSFTDLLSLQAGVTPATSITANTVQDVGASIFSLGSLNPGTLSINGQREFANAFIVNGSDAEEYVNMGTAIVPNLDSIAQFRILTNNFDAEYGEFSGGQINVITKSGTNQFHGGLFEFLRNTDLDARNYFSPERGVFHQNQYGATLGGPVRRERLFFFIDYQGTRQIQGLRRKSHPVPHCRTVWEICRI